MSQRSGISKYLAAMEHMLASLPQLSRREAESYPWNYTTSTGYVCNMPRPLVNTATATLAGGLYFFTIAQIITGVCAVFTLISISILMYRHATHLSRPNEQLNIMRICSYLPIFAIGCFLEASFPNAYVYIYPWLDVVQAIALCNFFLLMSHFVSPSDDHRELFFAGLKVSQKRKHITRLARRCRGGSTTPSEQEAINGLEWYRKRWLLIFQYPFVQSLVSIATAVTEAMGLYCLVGHNIHFARLWLDISHNVTLIFAMVACLRLYSALRIQLAHHKPLAKLFAFKLVVAITGGIQLIYWILRSVKPSPLKPTAYLSWSDEFIGIPAMIMALLTVPFSVFFHYAYDVKPYYLENTVHHVPLAHKDDLELSGTNSVSGGKFATYINVGVVGESYQGGPFGMWAWLGMMNPSELISGFVLGFTMLSKENRKMGVATIQRAEAAEAMEYDDRN